MKKLIEGVRAFRADVFPSKQQLFQDLVTKGQSPEVLFITCSDSRIDPGLVTQTQPGELFVLRNAGNAVPAHSADGNEVKTIEFALDTLGVGHIVVMGHYGCGAVEKVEEHALAQVKNLQTYPAVQRAIAKDMLEIHVWMYRI